MYVYICEHVHRIFVPNIQYPSIQCPPQDIRELIEILQRNENHMLASRVMMTSWYSDNTIGKSLNSSLLSLGRKVLGYRDIDCSLAVACYSTLSPNTMVRELQAVVSAPSTQVDFSRLYTLSGSYNNNYLFCPKV